MLKLLISFFAAALFCITFAVTDWIALILGTIGIYFFPGSFLFLVLFLFCAYMFSDRFK